MKITVCYILVFLFSISLDDEHQTRTRRLVLVFLLNDAGRVPMTMFRYSENHVPQQIQDVMRGWWCILGVSLVFVRFVYAVDAVSTDLIMILF